MLKGGEGGALESGDTEGFFSPWARALHLGGSANPQGEIGTHRKRRKIIRGQENYKKCRSEVWE